MMAATFDGAPCTWELRFFTRRRGDSTARRGELPTAERRTSFDSGIRRLIAWQTLNIFLIFFLDAFLRASQFYLRASA